MTSVLVCSHLLLCCFLFYLSDGALVEKNSMECLLTIVPNQCSLHNNQCLRSTCYVYDSKTSPVCKSKSKCTPNKGNTLCPKEDCETTTLQSKLTTGITQIGQTKTSKVSTETMKQELSTSGYHQNPSTTYSKQNSPNTNYQKPKKHVSKYTTMTRRKTTRKTTGITITSGKIIRYLVLSKIPATKKQRQLNKVATLPTTPVSATTSKPVYARGWFIAVMCLSGVLILAIILVIIICCCCCRKQKPVPEPVTAMSKSSSVIEPGTVDRTAKTHVHGANASVAAQERQKSKSIDKEPSESEESLAGSVLTRKQRTEGSATGSSTLGSLE